MLSWHPLISYSFSRMITLGTQSSLTDILHSLCQLIHIHFHFPRVLSLELYHVRFPTPSFLIHSTLVKWFFHCLVLRLDLKSV